MSPQASAHRYLNSTAFPGVDSQHSSLDRRVICACQSKMFCDLVVQSSLFFFALALSSLDLVYCSWSISQVS